MSRGLTAAGVAALETVLARHVERGGLAGLVALVASGGDVHVTTAGRKALGDAEPIGRDAIFRIASITKPIAGVAAMLLIQDRAMKLDDLAPRAGRAPGAAHPGIGPRRHGPGRAADHGRGRALVSPGLRLDHEPGPLPDPAGRG